MTDSNFYLGLATELVGKLRRLSSFTGHRPSVGSHHEEIVRECIRPLLSRRFSLRSGFAYANEGVVSGQGDILVVDESDPSPYFFQLGDLAVVHPRALAAVIEVKTVLAKDSFLEAVQNLHSFRTIGQQVEPKSAFPTAIFAFEGAKFSPENLHAWYEAVTLPDEVASYPQVIYSLREGLLHLRPSTNERECGHFFAVGEQADELKSRGLSLFLQTIRKSVEIKAGIKSNPFEYAQLGGLTFSKQFFKFGKGAFIEE